jgi:solute carrier family 31 (copper transporter), member 1
LVAASSQYVSSADNLESNSLDKSPGVGSDVEEVLKQNEPTQKPIIARARYSRTIPPFIAAHDVPRGILYSLQMFMMYLLMLAVMYAQSLFMFSLLLEYDSRTFQAAFFISIVLGLGIGEILFGRLTGRMAVP